MTNPVLRAGLLALAAFGAFGQEAAKTPEFETASIKPSDAVRPIGTFLTGCSTPEPGRFVCVRTSFRGLVMSAYGVNRYQVSGPEWMDSENFEIAAKVPAGASREQVNLMLQHLLAGRFQMTVHRETKDVPVYVLVVSKDGHQLKPFKDEDGKAPGGAAGAAQEFPGDLNTSLYNGVYEIEATGLTVPMLLNLISDQLDRPTLDETGLTGRYNFTLSFALGARPSLFSAIQSQLGLKLEPKTIQMQTIVVDQAGKTPAAN